VTLRLSPKLSFGVESKHHSESSPLFLEKIFHLDSNDEAAETKQGKLSSSISIYTFTRQCSILKR